MGQGEVDAHDQDSEPVFWRDRRYVELDVVVDVLVAAQALPSRDVIEVWRQD
jgi:hypothetical protein